jgi:hypothetical protein
VLLLITVPLTWRAYRRAMRRADQLSAYTSEQALEIERLTASLNEHGFELEHTITELGPRLEMIALFLRQPLVAATMPWILRRVFGRPYRRR